MSQHEPRRLHLVGRFLAEEEARELAAALGELGIEHERDTSPGPQPLHRVHVAERAGPPLREHFQALPVERWPPWIELVKRDLARLWALDPNAQATRHIQLAPPLGEAQVRALEQQHQVTLPASYRRFVTEVGDGGQFHVTWLSPLAAALASCSPARWAEPLAVDAQLPTEGPAEGPWPGLLRISDASYGGMITHLSRDGRAFLCIPTPDDDGLVTWEALGDWARGMWLTLARDIEPFARTLASMRMGATLEQLERGLGGPNTSRAYRDAVIGGLLGTEVSAAALTAWQAKHRR